MEYPVHIDGFEGRQLSVTSGGILAGARLFVDGQPAPKGPKRGQLLLRRNDGTEVVARLRGGFVDPIPEIIIDGKTVAVAEPLRWYQWGWAGLPLVLLILGGALGAIGAFINGRIFRSALPGIAKYVVTAMVFAGSVILFLLLASILDLNTRLR